MPVYAPGFLLNFCSDLDKLESDKDMVSFYQMNINYFSQVFDGPKLNIPIYIYVVICVSWIWISNCYNQCT